MKNLRPAVIFLVLLGLIAACKEPDISGLPKRKRAYVHFINLYPYVQSVDFQLKSFESQQNVFNNVGYLTAAPIGGYASFITTQNDTLLDDVYVDYAILNHANGDLLTKDTTFRLYNENFATMVFLNNGGNAQVVKTIDNFDPFTDSTGNIRFMNFNPDVLSVSLVSEDTSFKAPTLGYPNYTGFKAIKAGKHKFKLINNATGIAFDSLTTEIKLRKNYALYLARDYVNNTHKVIWEEMNK